MRQIRMDFGEADDNPQFAEAPFCIVRMFFNALVHIEDGKT
jgi:hypothetical protein